jgi:hypothetical protein
MNIPEVKLETLFGSLIILSKAIPEGEIHIHPETWLLLRPIARRNEVTVKIANQESQNGD